MKLVLMPVGSAGDVIPTLAIASALESQGHQTLTIASPWYESLAAKHHLPFAPAGPKDSAFESATLAREHPEMFARFGTFHLFRTWVPLSADAMFEDVHHAIQSFKPDRIILHPLAFAAWWSARVLDIEHVGFALSPSTFLSADDPSIYPVGFSKPGVPKWFLRFNNACAALTLRALADGPLNRIAKRRDLPRFKNAFTKDLTANLPIIAGAWAPEFRPSAPDDPPGLHITGFPFLPQPDRALSEPTTRFLNNHAPPIVVALGSVLSQSLRDEYLAIAGSIRKADHPAIFVAADDIITDAELPPNSIRTKWEPFDALFPRAALVVHHAGIGTTAQVLAAGKPHLILPQAHDQFDNAARVQRLDLGRSLAPPAKTDRIIKALQHLIEDPHTQAQSERIGVSIRSQNGASDAASLLTRPIPQ